MENSSNDLQEHLMVDVADDQEKEVNKFEVRNLKKVSESRVVILKGVRLDIPRGGYIVGIIGPSGIWKSTLLRALNRLWELAEGTVFFDGQDICDLDVLYGVK